MKKSNIPKLNPIELGSHLFGKWSDPSKVNYNSFHIEKIEKYKDILQFPILPHRRSVFYLVYVHTGKIIRSKILNKYEIYPGQLYFLAANITNTIEFVDKDTTGFYCHFNGDIFDNLIAGLDIIMEFPFFELTADPIMKIPDNDSIHKLLSKLYLEYKKNDKTRFEIIKLNLLTLLTELKIIYNKESFQKKINDAPLELTMKYKKALVDFMYEKSKVFEFADYLSVTSNHLNKYVKIATGKSAKDLLTEMKIIEAKVLLKQSDLSISEIGYKVTKMSQSDFSRFFKNNTSFTPSQYRKSSHD